MDMINLIESQSMPKCLDQGIRVREWQVAAQEHPSALYGVPENQKFSGRWLDIRYNNLPESYELYLDVT
jgi:hypothetical protein